MESHLLANIAKLFGESALTGKRFEWGNKWNFPLTAGITNNVFGFE